MAPKIRSHRNSAGLSSRLSSPHSSYEAPSNPERLQRFYRNRSNQCGVAPHFESQLRRARFRSPTQPQTLRLQSMDPTRVAAKDIPPSGCSSPGAALADSCYCGVDDLLRIIRRRYALAVMNAIQTRGSVRYHDIAEALPQASSSTLAETLSALEVSQLVRRRDFSHHAAPHTVYDLTPSGMKLVSRLRSLLGEVQQGPP